MGAGTYQPASGGGAQKTGAPGSSTNTPTSPVDFTVIITHGSPGSGKKTYRGKKVGDLMNEFRGLDKKSVLQMQEALIAAGLLTDTQIKNWGSGADSKTRQAYKKLLTLSSSSRRTPTETLNDLIAEKEAEAAKEGPGPFSFTPDDPAKLSRLLDRDIPEVLGHGLTEGEKAALIQRWQQTREADERSVYDTNLAGGTSRPVHDFDAFALDEAERLHPTDAGAMRLAKLSEEFLDGIRGGSVDRTF